MKIQHISVSRKKCFDECQQKYKFRYHLEVPNPGPEQFYFVYGKVVHKIAETLVETDGTIPIAEITKDVVEGRIPIEYNKVCPELPDEYKAKLKKHVKAIENLTKKIGTVGTVEYQFKYDLDPPNGRLITGFIDRYILKGRKAFIIDYKTTKKGKFRVNKETVKTDLQLRIYSKIIQKKYDLAAEDIQAALYYLEGEDLIACQYSQESLDNAEKELLEGYKRIEQSEAEKVWGNVGWHCKNCEYNTLCPFFKASNSNASGWDGDMTNLSF